VADKTPISTELSRELTLFQITMMGLGMMIGAGSFSALEIRFTSWELTKGRCFTAKRSIPVLGGVRGGFFR